MKKIISKLLLVALGTGLVFAGGARESGKMAYFFAAPHPYADAVEVGVNDYAEEAGVDIRIEYGTDWEQTTQDDKMRALAADGYEYFITYPSSGGAESVYSELIDNGMAVVGFGAETANQTEMLVVAQDVYAAAYAVTQEVIDRMGGEGGILNVLEVISDPNTAKRQRAVAACIADNPGVTLIQEVADIANIDQAIEKVGSAIAANAEKIDGIVITGTTTTQGTIQVLADYYARYPNGKRFVTIGVEDQPDILKGVADGIIDASLANNPYGHGYVGAAALHLLKQGYTVREGAYLIDGGSSWITQDTLETYSEDLLTVTNAAISELKTKYLEMK